MTVGGDKLDYPDALITCRFKHETRATTFVLCIDDFGIKYNNEDDLIHWKIIAVLNTYIGKTITYNLSINESERMYL